MTNHLSENKECSHLYAVKIRPGINEENNKTLENDTTTNSKALLHSHECNNIKFITAMNSKQLQIKIHYTTTNVTILNSLHNH